MPQLNRILCPVDFSEFSLRAYDYALSLAQHYRAKWFVEHVVEMYRYPSAGFATSAELYDEFTQRLMQIAGDKLQELVKNHGDTGVRPERVVEQGMAADS